MPYCASCGVELKSGATRCPLCGVRVVLPPSLRGAAADSTPPKQRDVAETAFDKSLWIQVVTVLMAIPALVCVVVNVAFGEGLTWSLYVIAILGAVWVWCVSPFLYRRNVVPLWIALDAVALLGLLYLVASLSRAGNWFLPVALPVTLGLVVVVLLVITLARRGVLRELHVVAAALAAIGVFCMIVEGAVDLYLTGAPKLQWSLLVLASCAPLAVIAALLQRRRAVVEGMKAWFRM
jgi:hypothetical protein